MTEYSQGRVLEVSEITAGSEVMVAHAEGETLLQLYDTSAFSDGGGELLIEDTVYNYLSKDDDLDTLLLSSGLAIALEEETEVWVHPGATSKEATVQVDEEDAIVARVPHSLIGLLETGIREPNQQESVLLTMESGEWAIHDVIAQTYTINGGYIPPETLPDPSVPVEPPGSSPEITDLVGTPGALIVAVGNVEPGTWVNYHISLTPNFAESEVNRVASTQSTVMVIKNLADGSPLLPEVIYYVKVMAENAIGTAPIPSEEREGKLDLDAVTSVIAERLIAGFILAGRIQVGQAYIDANEGIVIPQPDGGEIRLPIDGSSAKITANIIARSLTVEDQWSIFGWGRLGGVMTIQNQATSPDRPATLSEYLTSWDLGAWQLTPGAQQDYAMLYHGLAMHTDNVYAVINQRDDAVQIELFDKRTAVELEGSTNMPSANPGGFNPPTWGKSWNNYLTSIGGFTRLGTDYYMLVQDHLRNRDVYIYRIRSSTWDKVDEKRLGPANTFSNRPALTTDGVNLMLLFIPNSNNLVLRTIKADLTGNVTADRVLTSLSKPYHVLGAMYGNFGPASSLRLHVQLGVGTDHPARTFRVDTWARVPSEEMSAATPGGVRGMIYDHLLDRRISYNQYGRLTRYSKNTTSMATQVVYTWYDGDTNGGVHESAHSTPATLVLTPGRFLRVETDPAPDLINTDPMVVDLANRIGVYIGTNFLPPKREVYWPIGTRSGLWESFLNSGVAPPTVSNFDPLTSAQGRIRSAAGDEIGPLIDLYGNGMGRLGPYRWLPDGNPFTQTITVSFSGSASGSATLTRVGDMIYARVVATRTSWTDSDWVTIGTIPVDWRPPTTFQSSGHSASNSSFYQFYYFNNGTVQLRQSANHSGSMVSNDFWHVS